MNSEKANRIKEELKRKGLTVKSWAIQNHYEPYEVYKLFSGERKGLQGRSKQIAKDLGFWKDE